MTANAPLKPVGVEYLSAVRVCASIDVVRIASTVVGSLGEAEKALHPGRLESLFFRHIVMTGLDVRLSRRLFFVRMQPTDRASCRICRSLRSWGFTLCTIRRNFWGIFA